MKRRVALEDRKRAAKSCDRCKRRKVKCVESGSEPGRCTNCERFGLVCEFTIPRKHRVYGSFESLDEHYRLLCNLVQGLYKGEDINDCGRLRELGRRMGVDMGRAVSLNPKVQRDEPGQGVAGGLPGGLLPGGPAAAHGEVKTEKLILDDRGHRHYIGDTGTSVLFSILCSLLLKRANKKLSFESNIQLFQNKMDDLNLVIEVFNQHEISRFPVFRFLTRAQSDVLVDGFFAHLHCFYYIFDETLFRQRYAAYFSLLDLGDDLPRFHQLKDQAKLSSPAIGCVYLVWLIAYKKFGVDISSTVKSQIFSVLKLILSEISFASTLASIQFLYLFAVYLYSIKNRDSAWNVIGLAMRQAVSLGLHRNIDSEHEPAHKNIDLEHEPAHKSLSAQIFWSLYQMDLVLCCSFDRPHLINDNDVDVLLLPASSARAPTELFFRKNIRLSQLLSRVLATKVHVNLGSASSCNVLSIKNIEQILSMRNKFVEISKELELPPVGELATILDFKLFLLFHFYHLQLILPIVLFVITKDFNIFDDETVLGILQIGVNSALEIAKAFRLSLNSFDLRQLNDTDAIIGYFATLNLSLFFIYLHNNSIDTFQFRQLIAPGATVLIVKNDIIEFVSDILQMLSQTEQWNEGFMKRIIEILKGLRTELVNISLQDVLDSKGIFDGLLNDVYGDYLADLDLFEI